MHHFIGCRGCLSYKVAYRLLDCIDHGNDLSFCQIVFVIVIVIGMNIYSANKSFQIPSMGMIVISEVMLMDGINVERSYVTCV